MATANKDDKAHLSQLRKMCSDMYDNDDDVEHVVQSAIQLGTVEALVNGTRRLPSPEDVRTREERLRTQARLDRNK